MRDAYATTYRVQPTADNPAADGFDTAKADEAAKEAIAALQHQRDAVRAAERVLRDAVAFVAFIANVTPDEAFKLLTAA